MKLYFMRRTAEVMPIMVGSKVTTLLVLVITTIPIAWDLARCA